MNVKGVKPYFLEVLESELGRRKEKNPAYSLRAFAKDLNINPSSLSPILRGKRAFPISLAENACDRLYLSPQKKEAFLSSLVKAKTSLRELTNVKTIKEDLSLENKERNFNLIAEWEYFAIINLSKTDDFQSDIAWISKRLGINEFRVNSVVSDLFKLGLLVEVEGQWRCPHKKIVTSDGIPSSAIRKGNKQVMEMGLQKMETIPLSERYFCSDNYCIDASKVDEVKTLIKEFRGKLSTFLTQGKRNEVYAFAVQFFPMTQKIKAEG